MRLLLISPKDAYATRRLKEEGRAAGVAVTAMDIRELAAANYKVDIGAFDALFVRQGYVETGHKMGSLKLRPIVDLARSFSDAGKVVIDSALAKNGLGKGKLEVYRALEQAGVPVPRTEVLAEIDAAGGAASGGAGAGRLVGIGGVGGTAEGAAGRAFSAAGGSPRGGPSGSDGRSGGRGSKGRASIKYPKVLKWNFGFGAQHVYYVDSAARLAEIAARYLAEEILVQEFIRAPREYKFIVVGYKALPVAVRYGINPEKHVPDLKDFEVIQTARVPELTKFMERAARATERELCKIDVLEVPATGGSNGAPGSSTVHGENTDAPGRFYVLEVNRWPGLKPFEEASGFNVAREFVEYLRGLVG